MKRTYLVLVTVASDDDETQLDKDTIHEALCQGILQSGYDGRTREQLDRYVDELRIIAAEAMRREARVVWS